MEIKVLGACCKKSLETFENTKRAAIALGLKADVENIGDDKEIAAYGVMSTPAIVVDDKVILQGRFLKQRDAENVLRKYLKM